MTTETQARVNKNDNAPSVLPISHPRATEFAQSQSRIDKPEASCLKSPARQKADYPAQTLMGNYRDQAKPRC